MSTYNGSEKLIESVDLTFEASKAGVDGADTDGDDVVAIGAQQYAGIPMIVQFTIAGADTVLASDKTITFRVKWSATEGGTYLELASRTITDPTLGTTEVVGKHEVAFRNSMGGFLKASVELPATSGLTITFKAVLIPVM